MLPPAHRMRRRNDFAAAVKGGTRSAGRLLVIHARPADGPYPSDAPTLVGFVVPRTVGNSVVRNRVQRRLRHLLVPRLSALPAGSRVVVRVLPPAGTATSDDLQAELDSVLVRLNRRWDARAREVVAR